MYTVSEHIANSGSNSINLNSIPSINTISTFTDISSTNLNTTNYSETHLAPKHATKKKTVLFSEREIQLLRSSWSTSITDSCLPLNLSRIEFSDTDSSASISALLSSSNFWAKVYEFLLKRYPELKDSLPSLKHQTISFTGIVHTIVMNLEDLKPIGLFLADLGRLHGRVFNTESVHFEAMGIALIDTFIDTYNFFFNNELRILWGKLFNFLAVSMIEAEKIDIILDSVSEVFPKPIVTKPSFQKLPDKIERSSHWKKSKINKSTLSRFNFSRKKSHEIVGKAIHRVFERFRTNSSDNYPQFKLKSTFISTTRRLTNKKTFRNYFGRSELNNEKI